MDRTAAGRMRELARRGRRSSPRRRRGTMSDMNWIRGVFGALVLAVVVAFSGVFAASPAFAQQIVVESGSGVTPESLKPYFSGTDPASVQRGVDDLKATGIYSMRQRQGGGRPDRRHPRQHRQADPQPRRLRGQQQDHQGPARGRGAVEARARSTTKRPPKATSAASRTPTRNTAATSPGSPSASSSCRTGASTSSSPSTKAKRPASAKSSSSATTRSRPIVCTT